MTADLECLVLPAYDTLSGLPSELDALQTAFDATHTIEVPGLSRPIACTDDRIGIVPTGVGKLAAATTVMTIAATDAIDLADATVVSAGIAGGPPQRVTTGSLVVASTIVDWDNKLRFDRPRSANQQPVETNPYNEAHAVHRLDEEVVDRFAGAIDAEAHDRAVERAAAGTEIDPTHARIHTGTNLCGDELFHGHEVAAQADELVAAHGCDPYLVTQMEDMGTAVALDRLDRLDQYVSVRAVSNPDRPADPTVVDGLDPERFATGADIALAGLAAGIVPAVRKLAATCSG